MNNTNFIKLIKGGASFDEIQNYIMTDIVKSNDIIEIRNLLKKWKDSGINIEQLQINEKWIIIVYVLAHYPFEGDIQVDSVFYIKIREFINCIDEEREVNEKLLTTLKLLYDKWKKDDWNATMQVLLGVYIEYDTACEDTFFNNESDKEIWISFRNIVLDIIKKLAPINYQNHIDKYRAYYEINGVDNLNNIKEKVYDNMKQIYWQNLKTEYDEHKEEQEKILIRIYDDFCSLEDTLLSMINKETAERNMNDYTEESLVWNIINKLKKYDSKYLDSIYDSMYVKWTAECSTNIFIEFIHFLFNRLEIIISLISKRHEKK
jgi:hypothetical protein